MFAQLSPPEQAIAARLLRALVQDGPFSQALYEHELEEAIGYWRQGMRRDKDDFFLAITENQGDVALLLIDKKGRQYINEAGRHELRRRWSAPGVYERNMLLFIPDMARQLHGGDIWTMGVRVQPAPPQPPKFLN